MAFIFEVGGDSSGFESTLQGMEHMSEKFSHKFMHHLSKAFGIGFLAHEGIKLIKETFGNAAEIEEMSKKWGKNTDEIQLLQAAAKEAGMTFEEYMEKAAKSGQNLNEVLKIMRGIGVNIIPREQVEQLAEAEKNMKGFGRALVTVAMISGGSILKAVKDVAKGRFGEVPADLATALFPFTAMAFDAHGKMIQPTKTDNIVRHRVPNFRTADRERMLEGRLDTLSRMELLFGDQLTGMRDSHRTRGRSISEWNPVTGFIRHGGAGGPSAEERALGQKLDAIREEAKLTNLELARLRRGEGS